MFLIIHKANIIELVLELLYSADIANSLHYKNYCIKLSKIHILLLQKAFYDYFCFFKKHFMVLLLSNKAIFDYFCFCK